MSSSSSFEAKDYQIPSKSNPCIDDHNLSSNHQTSLKSPPQHRLSKNHNQPPPPSQQQLPTPTHPSEDHHILKNLNQLLPPSLQPSSPPSPPRTRYSNVEQPKKDNHAKLTSREPVTVHPKSKNYLSQPDRPPPPPPPQQQPPTRILPSNIEKPDKQPITLAKQTSDDEAPPSQPSSPAQTLPSKDQHLLENSPLPLPSPPPPSRTRPWNVEQPTIIYKQPTNHVASPEPETVYPKNYLLQPDGPPPPQPHPLAQTFSPKDQLKNLKLPPARTLASNVDQQPENYKQVSNNINQTNANPVTAYPENFYSQPNGPQPYQPPPPPPPPKKWCPCSIL